MTGVTHVPRPTRMLAAAQTLVMARERVVCGSTQKSIDEPKRCHKNMNNEATRWVKRTKNICIVQYINILCSAFFFTFFLLLLNNYKFNNLGQIYLSRFSSWRKRKKNQFVIFLCWHFLMKKSISVHIVFFFF